MQKIQFLFVSQNWWYLGQFTPQKSSSWQLNVFLFSYLPSVTCFCSISLLAIDEVKMVIWQLLPTTCFSAHQPTWLPQHHVDSTEPASVQGFTRNRFPYKPQGSPFCHCSLSLPAVCLRSLKEDVPKQLSSKAMQISVSLSISNRRICFLFKKNHWHCVSVSNQPHMPFCKNSSLIITVPSFFFPTNLLLLS